MKKNMPKRKGAVKTVSVSARIPEAVLAEMEKVIAENFYMDISDYLREIIRKDLLSRKIKEC